MDDQLKKKKKERKKETSLWLLSEQQALEL